MKKQNIRIMIAYDGTGYLGWQKTKMGPSIEEALQNVLEQILQEPISLQAASRTDAGVHAQGQVVNFFTTKAISDSVKFQISLNSLLPKNIAILHVENAETSFHPTLDCTGKEYHYAICTGSAQMPHQRLYSWHYPYELDINAMRQAASFLIGKQDFSAFCNEKKNECYDSTIREIKEIMIEESSDKRILIKTFGSSFLYKMVRNIVGTLAYVGRGKIGAMDISEILAKCDRTQAGMTAPAHGLTLFRVYY